MSKSLSEMLEASEPTSGFCDSLGNNMIDRESYEKLKAVAIELSRALSISCQCNHPAIISPYKDIPCIKCATISRAKDILESK